MSDLEKLFEHAPDGAHSLKSDGHIIRFFNKHSCWWSGMDKAWHPSKDISSWKTIATRPQPGQPRKTVEDAVEWNESVGLGDEWGHEDCDVIIIYRDGFAYSDSRATSKEIACTREEFEACVAAKAKSEHEWTHVLNSGARCKFFKSLEWMQGDVYESEDGKFFIPQRTGKSYSIKPIKPTISKDEKAQLELYVQYRIDKYGDHAMKSDLIDYLAKHEVVK